jgi:hypothetical protein
VYTQANADDVVVNAKELAQALRVSRWTLTRWREKGYQFEFGNRSTPGRLKEWLRDVHAPIVAESKRAKQRELERKLSLLH